MGTLEMAGSRALRRVCVYCGASPGRDDAYAAAARDLGRRLAGAGIGLVFGAGSVGMMGLVADAALAAGGEVIGVIPDGLKAREIAHQGVTELHVVASMHARKAMMNELSDAFVALPGGFGTLDELFEIVTWAQLGIHRKPIALLNVAGYFDALLAFLDRAVADGFVRERHRELFVTATDTDGLLRALHAYEPPEVPRWISARES